MKSKSGMSRATQLALSVLLLGGLIGCSKPSLQCHDFFHRLSNPGEKDLFLIGVVQEVDHTPVYAICLLSDRSNIVFSNQAAQITAIEGHSIGPSLRKKAIYALNPDFTLREISLSEKQVEASLNDFGKIVSGNGEVDLTPLRDELGK